MSHKEAVDLRIRRTHHSLQEAIIELIDEKGFDAITVGDIAERAMINRATFYRHYQDKYDLVARIFEEVTTQLVEDMKPVYDERDPLVKEEHLREMWTQLFAHVAAHARMYRAMLGKNGSSWFVARMRDHCIKLVLEREQGWERQRGTLQPPDPSMPKILPVVQLSHVLIGTIVWWLENDMRATPGDIASWFYRFAYYGYVTARGYDTGQR